MISHHENYQSSMRKLKYTKYFLKPPRAPQLEETPETPPSSQAEGLLFLHGLESNPGSSLQTEEEAGLP